MSVLVEFLAWLVADTFVGSLVDVRRSRVAARSFAAEGRVTSGIRAVEGRVENIGTEWSAGVAEIAPGHIRFIPRIGIVGIRDIAVVDISRDTLPMRDVPVALVPSQVLIVTTLTGALYWQVPVDLVDRIIERILPTDPRAV